MVAVGSHHLIGSRQGEIPELLLCRARLSDDYGHDDGAFAAL